MTTGRQKQEKATRLESGRALKLFRSFARDFLLTAGGTDTACDWRADIIARRLAAEGYAVRKIWCWSADRDNPRAPVENEQANITFGGPSPKERHVYNFHVATAIKTGERDYLVIDPVLYDGPVTLRQWCCDFRPVEGRMKTMCMTPCGVSSINEALEYKRRNITSACLPCVPSFNDVAAAYKNLGMLVLSGKRMKAPPPGRSEWMCRNFPA